MRNGGGNTASHRCLISGHSLQTLSKRRAKRIPPWIGSRRVACVPISIPCEAALVKPRQKSGLFTTGQSSESQRPQLDPSLTSEARNPSRSTLSRRIVRLLCREHRLCGDSTQTLDNAFRIEFYAPKDFDTVVTRRWIRVSREVELCTKLSLRQRRLRPRWTG